MDFKSIGPYILALVFLLVIASGLFPSALQGKVVLQPDRVTAAGKENEVVDHYEKTGEWSLWTNQIFGGMPTFYGGAKYPSILLKPVAYDLIMLGLPKPINYFFLAFVCSFVLFLTVRAGPWTSFLGALAFGLCTYNFVIFEAGHDNKLFAIALFPLVAAGMLMVMDRGKYILGGALFAFALGSQIMTSHIQMTYYLAIACVLYMAIKLIYNFKEGTLNSYFKGVLYLSLAAVLAISANSSRLLSSYEYMKETMRGPKVLTEKDEASVDSKDGLAKDYVFNWSHGISETLTFLVPGAYGGASQEKIDESSAYYKSMRRLGVTGPVLDKAPLYWGDMPGTSGPVYFGAIVCLLFVMGLVLVQNEIRWWLLGATLLTVFLSFGKNLEWFNDLFYFYFPMYDKFRAVSSILVIPQLTLSLLGIIGLMKILQNQVEAALAMKALKIGVFVTGGICVLAAIFGGSVFDFEGANDVRYATAGYDISAIISDRKDLMRSDAIRSLIFILIAAVTLWLYISKKVELLSKKNVVVGFLSVMMLIDLGGIGKRYLDSSNFVTKRQYEQNWELRSVDKEILKDTDPNFRVHDMSISTYNSNSTSYHHKTIGGYHAAKLRRYQDMIERHIAQGNLTVLNMLNTKYIIDQRGKLVKNNEALGHAWFVKHVEEVENANKEINALKKFSPRDTAIMHQEFAQNMSEMTFSGIGNIELSEYLPNHLTYSSRSDDDQLAVFSEVWYDPGKGKGWQVYIDGEEVEHVRVNYLLRALPIPAGKHTIEFKFFPDYYYFGESISLISSILLLLVVIAALIYEIKGFILIDRKNKQKSK